MNKYVLTLAWPSHLLSPNQRYHWAEKAKIKTKYRSDCFYLTKHQIKDFSNSGEKIPLKVTFMEPDAKSRDLDNCLASIKSGLDGVCDALRIDDYLFRPITLDICGRVSGGAVILEF